MSENTQVIKDLFETLEEKSPAFSLECNSKLLNDEHNYCDDDKTAEFMIQDMFLDHFFP